MWHTSQQIIILPKIYQWKSSGDFGKFDSVIFVHKWLSRICCFIYFHVSDNRPCVASGRIKISTLYVMDISMNASYPIGEDVSQLWMTDGLWGIGLSTNYTEHNLDKTDVIPGSQTQIHYIGDQAICTVDSRYLALVGSQNSRARVKWFSRYLALSRECADSRIQDHRPTLPGVYKSQTVCWAIIEVLTFPESLHTWTSHQRQITTSNIRF